jgi:2-oxoglutarate ferredoxin oxidoreductase subunit delta
MGVQILKESCKGCGYCVEICPKKVLKLKEEEGQMNIKGNYVPSVISPEKCTRCRLCELICPDFAIEVEEGE